ncbi:MAG: sugar ABC transporter substrate-binding protein [Mesorhizobium sp.]|nr:MAG: sugar ABC transporter substrate-binding protein [Mesorhizobium sp.]
MAHTNSNIAAETLILAGIRGPAIFRVPFVRRRIRVNLTYKIAALAGVAAVLSGPAYAADPIRIALFGFAADNAFTLASLEGLKEAAKEAGDVEIELFDGAFDADRQFNQIQDAVASGRFNGMLILPMGYSSAVPAAEEAIKAGIKFGSLEYPLGPDPTTTDKFQVMGMTTFVGYNVGSIGLRLAEATVEACQGRDPCKVALLVGSRSAAQDVPKIEAFNKHIAEHPSIKLVSTQDTLWGRELGLKVTQDVLQSNPDLDVITSFADQAAAGAEVALTGAGMNVGGEGIQLIGLGATQTAVAAIRQGRWYGTYVELPYMEGYLGGKNIIAAMRGQEFEPIIDLETRSPVGAAIATKTNLNAHPDWSSKWDG